MERENWTNSNFSITNELNCPTDQVGSCFLNPEWENSMDQSDPFESALSSMVSSPAASNAGGSLRGGGGDGFVLGELIGRLGSICNSPQFNIKSNNNNNSTETSCYSTPLNSPPKLNLSMMMDQQQIRGNLPIPGNNPNFPPFSADPGFAERAARFSCFSSTSRNYGGYPNGQLGLNETEFPYRSTSGMESGKLSSVSSNHSLKIPGSQMSFEEKKDGFLSPIGNSNSDKKFNRLSMSPEEKTEEFGDSREESSVSEQNPGGEIGLKGQNVTNSRKRKSIPKGKAKDLPPSPSPSVKDPKAGNEESNSKRSKADEATRGKEKMVECIEEEEGNQKAKKENAKPTPEPPKDYIHVRARRGQATDSHSLAERVRREKISERMKLLQDLVPGCNKVTGKAVMLDEIINYVQSLQRQVEFLSMKLATVNPRMDFTMDSLLSKDIFQSRLQTNYPLDSSASAFPFGYQSQGPSVQAAIHNGTETLFAMNPLNAALRRNSGVQLPPINGFNEASSQASAFWEDDLLTVVQMGFGQKEPQCLSGTMAAAQMKIEL